MKRIVRLSCALLVAVPLVAAGVAEERPAEPPPARSIAELQARLEAILAETKTPGMSIALVRRDGPEWVAARGLADVARQTPATAKTLFRIGSTSKAFASLAVLKLEREGRVSLDTPLRELAPEIEFDNRWEATDPVRLVDLLEHTTGWDDIHLPEYAEQAPAAMTLREALAFHPHSRVSRWRPGTRMAYCNSGPPVAAYVVEKLTGRRFEQYVQEHLFAPIGMTTATYFRPGPAGAPLTELYHPDGTTPYPYWDILVRPSGSINASAEDMAAYLAFYLGRGTVGGVEMMPAAAIDRMERPTRTWAARRGLAAGYGLSNDSTIHDGFLFHGHNGGVEGGLTELGYLPEAGYFFSLNAGSGDAFTRVGKAIRAYLTRELAPPPVPLAAALPAGAAPFAGWYEPDSPRVEMVRFLERLLGLSRIELADGKLVLASLGDLHQEYVPVEGGRFRRLPKDEAPDPVATLALLAPADADGEGRFVQAGPGTDTLKRIPTALAWSELALTAWFVLAVVAVLLYLPFWLLAGLVPRRRRPAERALRLLPLAAVASLFVVVFTFVASDADLLARMGNVTPWSLTIFAATLTFAAATLAGLVAWHRARGDGVRPGFRRVSLAILIGLLIAAAYLAYWGAIGLRTWS